jgi:citrate lyase subunit beta/citryl-CoA lyase
MGSPRYWPMRSKLFVPGSRPELFPKALASGADSLSIDLQDAVAEARAATLAFLGSAEAATSKKILIVRVNIASHPGFAEDLRAMTHPRIDLINLPAVQSPDEVAAAGRLIEQYEREHGVSADRPIGILANIESARGLRLAHEIAAAHPRVAGIQIGYADLFEDAGIARYDSAHVQHVLMAIRLAAAEAGVFAYDGAYADIGNAEGFRAEALMARRLGFHGKSCIHPKQIAIANEVFGPSEAEIDQARRIVAAAAKAEAEGVGAFTLDGKMVDLPFIRRAETLLKLTDSGKT